MISLIESSTITGIYVGAAAVGIVAGSVAIFLFFRRRQFSRPTLQLIFDWGMPLDDVPRKLRKRPVTMFVIAPKRELRKPLLTFLMFVLRNPGREAIKNVRISFEYGEQFLVSNQLFESLADIQPTLIPELSDSKTARILQSTLSKDDIRNLLQERHVDIFAERAQVSWEIPIVRPGESLITYDLLLLPGSGPDDIQKLGFGAGGFSHIVALLGNNKDLLDYLVVNTLVFSENHENLNSKISILRFPSEKEVEGGLSEFHKALWLGQLPKPGLYYSEPISLWLRHRFWGAGRRSPEIFRDELGLIRYATIADIKAQGRRFTTEVPEHSESQYFAFSSPNYDYFNLPANVDSFDSLMNWLGLPKRPTLPPLKKPKS